MAKDYITITEGDYGVIKLLISDNNPLFKDFESTAEWLLKVMPSRVIVQPTGLLQRHSFAINRQSKGKKIEPEKLREEGQVKERQTLTKTLGDLNILSTEAGYIDFKVKPLDEHIKTPEPRARSNSTLTNTVAEIQLFSSQLEAQLKALGIPYKRRSFPESIGGSIKAEESMRPLLGAHQRLVDLLKEAQSKFLHQTISHFPSQKLFDKDFQLADFIINPLAVFMPAEMKEEEFFNLEKFMIFLPFGALVNQAGAIQEYHETKEKFEKLLTEKKHQENFTVLVSEISELRQAKEKEAIEQVENFLREEIPLLMLDVLIAVEIYERTGQKTGLCYPVSEGAQGGLVLERTLYYCEMLGVNYQEAIDIVDITNLLKQKPALSEAHAEHKEQEASSSSRIKMSLKGISHLQLWEEDPVLRAPKPTPRGIGKNPGP